MKPIAVIRIQIFTLLVFTFTNTLSLSTQAATVSDLLITEIMANPAAVLDTQGEWFEVFNPTSESIDINGIILSDTTGDSHTISNGSSLLVDPENYFVLARNGSSPLNGGVIADYVYSGFFLTNSRDEIIFSDDSGELLRLDYGSGFAPAGSSMELIDTVMLQSNYAASTTAFGLGDLGTPGTAGSFTQFNTPSAVPLPGAAWLMASGLLGLMGFRRRQKT